jgi:hypothetical protein
MEDKAQGNYPPILVQTFFKQVVEENGNRIAIKYKEGKNVKSLTYDVSMYTLLVVVPCNYDDIFRS